MQNTCVCVYVCVGVWENICDSVCVCLCMYTCENIHVCVCMCVCVCHIAKCSKCNNFFNVKYLFSHRKHDALRSSKLFLFLKKNVKYLFSHRNHDPALRSSKLFSSTCLKPSHAISPARRRYVKRGLIRSQKRPNA
jgi:hypothetical protein